MKWFHRVNGDETASYSLAAGANGDVGESYRCFAGTSLGAIRPATESYCDAGVLSGVSDTGVERGRRRKK